MFNNRYCSAGKWRSRSVRQRRHIGANAAAPNLPPPTVAAHSRPQSFVVSDHHGPVMERRAWSASPCARIDRFTVAGAHLAGPPSTVRRMAAGPRAVI